MLRNFPLPPAGGLCVDQPRELFVDAQTEEQIQAGLVICKQCPILAECEQWAEDCLTEDNRGRPDYLMRRVPLQGVIARRYYVPTDQEGQPLHIQTLQQDSETSDTV